MRSRTITRVGLAVLAAQGLLLGAWATASPRGYFNDFPGLGLQWVAGDGPYNEHLMRDYGALNLALGVFTLCAAVWLTRELAVAAAVLRDRINQQHMLAGVTIADPASTWIDVTVSLEIDATVHPFTVLRGATTVAAGAEIGPHVVAVDASVGEGAIVGPFCYLRPGTVLEAGAKAGTFVEIKNSRIGARTKVPHLSYIGDADIGEDTNIAAANVTANFPHDPAKGKGRTTIGRNVRTGVDNTFVAPVTVGDDAWVSTGTVVTDDVPPGSLAGFAPRQETKEGWVYERGKRGQRGDD